MARSREYGAFGGRVMFHMTYSTTNTEMKQVHYAKVLETVIDDADSSLATRANFMCYLLPVTTSITFANVDTLPDELCGLHEFWQRNPTALDPLEVWELWRELVPLVVMNEWMRLYNQRNEHLLASPVLRASDEALKNDPN